MAHRFVASGLFIIANVLYSRYHTRILRFYRGLLVVYPFICIYFFLLSLSNIGLPLTLNFLGEFYCLFGIFQRSYISCFLASLGIVLSLTYTFLLFNRIFFGVFSPYLRISFDLNRLEFIYLSPFVLFPIVFGLFPSGICNAIYLTLNSLLCS